MFDRGKIDRSEFDEEMSQPQINPLHGNEETQNNESHTTVK